MSPIVTVDCEQLNWAPLHLPHPPASPLAPAVRSKLSGWESTVGDSETGGAAIEECIRMGSVPMSSGHGEGLWMWLSNRGHSSEIRCTGYARAAPWDSHSSVGGGCFMGRFF
jgi:hypothetical protein